MRRAVVALAATVVAVVPVVNFKTHGPHRLAATRPAHHATPAPTATATATPARGQACPPGSARCRQYPVDPARSK
jgi:hypothetical protein